MFFPKEHRKRCKKAHFARFYTVFAFSTCQLRKKKEHIGSKGTNLLVQASYFTHPTDEKGEKGFNTLVLPEWIQLPFTFLMAEQ